MRRRQINFARLRSAFGDRHIKTPDGKEIQDWIAATDLAVKTRNNYLGYIQNMFRMAQKWDLIEHNIFAKVDKFRNRSKTA